MTCGGIDHRGRRRVGETAAEHEMVGVGGLDGGARHVEIAFRQQREECVAVDRERTAPGIGTIVLVLVARTAFVRWLAPIGLRDARCFDQLVPGLCRRAP